MSLPTALALARSTRTGPGVEPIRVTLYTRALCCCCHSAREVLGEYREAFGIEVEEVDATDPALEAIIGPTVPVIAVDGKVRFRGEVNRVLMDRLVDARIDRG